METNTTTQEVTKQISADVQLACDICTGKIRPDMSASPAGTITGAKKDLNCKGRGPQWYRMVLRNNSWEYVSSDRLPNGSFLASDRRASVYGDVYEGELVASHDRGAAFDVAWIVTKPNTDGKVLCKISFATRRDGQLEFTLPDGSKIVTNNPRKRN